MPEVKNHTIHRNKKRKKLEVEEVVFIIKTEVPANKSSFPEKLKKINKLLEKTTFLPE